MRNDRDTGRPSAEPPVFEKQEVQEPKRRSWPRKLWRVITFPFRAAYKLLKVLGALLALVAIIAAGTAFYFLHDADSKLKNVAALTNPSQARLPEPTRIYSADGQLIGQTATQQRIVVTGRDIPRVMRNAIVAIEDQRYFEHHGVDWRGILRAAWVNYRANDTVQGASTITQQYVRNVYLDFEKTNARKIKEMSLAWQLEAMWSKQRILDAYLNTVYFSNGRYGVEAASRHFFGRPATNMRSDQAALLAAIVKDPDAYDPRRHPKPARERRDRVLDEMFAQGMLTRKQVVRAKRRPLRLHRLSAAERRQQGDRQLTEFVLAELRRTVSKVDRARGGLNVYTSLRMKDIRFARRTLEQVYGNNAADKPLIAVSFVDPRNGRIQLMASSRDDRSFNAAAHARRQPGSTVKAFTAATLLTQGVTLNDRVDNSPVTVRNGTSSYTLTPTTGVSTLQDALRWSQNPAFWRLYEQAGPKQVLALERRLGLTDMDANPSAALGGTRLGASTLQMASAYGTFVADGVHHRPHAIVTVTDVLGNRVHADGDADADSAHDRTEALPVEFARQMTAGLRRVVNDGFPQLKESIAISDTRDIGGKTGTTNNNVDAWFAGFTGQLAGAVWTGFESSQTPLRDVAGQEVFGMSVPAETWNTIADHLLRDEPNVRFRAPSGVQQIPEIRGRTVEDAQAQLARFGFSATLKEKFNASKPNRTVLTVEPAEGSWLKPDEPVTVTYSIAEQPMPNLVGLSYLEFLDVQSRFFAYRFALAASNEPTGTIIAQTIPAGQITEKGAEVRLTLATRRAPPKIVYREYVPEDSELARLRRQLDDARQLITVPDVNGLFVEDAERVLTSLGLTVRVVGSGLADMTDPEPNSRLPLGAEVTVYGDE
jgi:penicillin-binding protein 1A